MLSAKEDGSLYNVETFVYFWVIRVLLRLSCSLKFKLYHMDVKNVSLNTYLNMEFNQGVSNYATKKDGVIKKGGYVEVEDFPFANIMKKIMESLTKSHDNATQEKNHVVNNVSDIIDDVVNDYVSVNEGYIPMNNEVHDRYGPVNEGVTKDVDICKRADKKLKKIVDGNKIPTNVSIASLYNMYFHYEESVLKWKYLYHKWIALERKLSKETLTCEEVFQLLEDIIVKGNENLMRTHVYVDDMTNKMVEHVVHQMQLSMV